MAFAFPFGQNLAEKNFLPTAFHACSKMSIILENRSCHGSAMQTIQIRSRRRPPKQHRNRIRESEREKDKLLNLRLLESDARPPNRWMR